MPNTAARRRLPRLFTVLASGGLALAFALAGGLAPAAAIAAEVEVAAQTGEALSGSYRYAGSASQAAAIDAAIEEAVSKFEGPLRDFARKRLKEANAIPSEVGLEVDASASKVSLDRRAIRTRAGKTALYTDRSGTTSRVTHEVADGRLIERLITAEGKRRNDYRLSDDGRTLTMSVTIRSPHLAKDVRYNLTFARE